MEAVCHGGCRPHRRPTTRSRVLIRGRNDDHNDEHEPRCHRRARGSAAPLRRRTRSARLVPVSYLSPPASSPESSALLLRRRGARACRALAPGANRPIDTGDSVYSPTVRRSPQRPRCASWCTRLVPPSASRPRLSSALGSHDPRVVLCACCLPAASPASVVSPAEDGECSGIGTAVREHACPRQSRRVDHHTPVRTGEQHANTLAAKQARVSALAFTRCSREADARPQRSPRTR